MESDNFPEDQQNLKLTIKSEKSKEFALIMKGGGAKGLAYVGALQVLEEYGYKFTWFVGTSAGAIIAVLLAAGYSPKDLEKILKNTEFKEFKDVSLAKLIPNIVFRGGVFSGDNLKTWIENLLNDKLKINKPIPIKLEHLHKENNYRLTVYAATKSKSAADFDSHNAETKGYDASWVIRASASIPYFFTRTYSQDGYVFDGGLSHNYPIDVFLNNYNEDKKLNFLGLYLGDRQAKYNESSSTSSDILDNWLSGNDKTGIAKYGKQTIVIDPSPITTLRFNLNETEKEFLLVSGRASALEFIFHQKHVKKRPSLEKVQQAKELENSLRTKVKNTYKKRRLKKVILTLSIISIFFASLYYFFLYNPKPSPHAKINSLIIMPFEDNTHMQNKIGLWNYLRKEITSKLRSNIKDLIIIADESIKSHIEGNTKNADEIAKKLNADGFLTGSLDIVGGQVILTYQLVSTDTNSVLWDGKKSFLFKSDLTEQEKEILKTNFENELSVDLAKAIRPNLTSEETKIIGKSYTSNIEAEQFYIEASSYFKGGSKKNLDDAIEMYEASMLKDSNYVLPYTELAFNYARLEDDTGISTEKTLPRAHRYIEKAIELDKSFADNYAVQGVIDSYSWKWESAESNFKKAIEMEPSAKNHYLFSRYLRTQGRFEEALFHLKEAERLAPSYPIAQTNFGLLSLRLGKYDEAIDFLNRAIKLNSIDATFCWLAVAYVEHPNPNFDLAKNNVETCDNKIHQKHDSIAFKGYIYAKIGKTDLALSQATELISRYKSISGRRSAAIYIAMVYAGLGDKENTFYWLNKGIEDKSGSLPNQLVMPMFDFLRDDERFRKLLTDLKLPYDKIVKR